MHPVEYNSPGPSPTFKYRDAVLIGRGTSADLYRVIDVELDRPVALKVLRPGSETSTRRILREARALAKLSHESICRVFEVGQLDDRPFIAMQYVDGTTVAEAAADASLETKLQWMLQIVDALRHVHRRGLVHRDVTPKNIVITRQGRAVLVDFGLVHDCDGTRATSTGQLIGTPSYMAPEQAAGAPDAADQRTDVYGVGATLFELVTGHPPFDGASTLEVVWRVVHESPPRPRRLDPAIDRNLEAVILRCLEKNPHHRYRSMSRLASDLRRLQDGRPVGARRRVVPALARRGLQRLRRSSSRALGAVALCTIAIAAALWWRIDRVTADDTAEIQSLVQEAAALDRMIHTAHQRPIADFEETTRRALERMSVIERKLDASDDGIVASAHYALGRGHLALLHLVPARDHLEASWRLGFRTEEVAYSLGLAYAMLYERRAAEIDLRWPTAARDRERERLLAELGEPITRYLTISRASDTLPTPYMEALIKLYEEDYEGAAALASEALSQFPWLHEARVLRGRVRSRQASQAFSDGATDRAFDLLRQARTELTHAVDEAPSSPDAHLDLCRLEVVDLRLRYHRWFQIGDVAPARTACRRARVAGSGQAQAWTLSAAVELMDVVDLIRKGHDASASTDRASSYLQTALDESLGDVHALRLLGDLQVYKANSAMMRSKRDPRPELAKAEAIYTRVLRQSPSQIDAFFGLGRVDELRDRWLLHAGETVGLPYDRALSHYRSAMRLAPNDTLLSLRLAHLLNERAAKGLEIGADCEHEAREAVRLYDQVHAVLGEGSAAELGGASARLSLAAVEVHLGRDVTDLLAEVDRKVANNVRQRPRDSVWFFVAVQSAGAKVHLALLRGLPARNPLDEARELLDRAPAQDDVYLSRLRFALEILAVRASIRSGAPATEALQRAGDALVALERRATFLVEPEHRLALLAYTAADRVEQGDDAQDAIDATWQVLRPLLLESPDRGLLRAYEGLLLSLEARTSDDPALAAASCAAFDDAVRFNRWLALEVERDRERACRRAGRALGVNDPMA